LSISIKKTFRRFFELTFLFLIFISCAGVPQGSARGEGRFSSIEEVTPQWTPMAAGIGIFHAKTVKPRLEMWAVRADLAQPGLHVIVKGGQAWQALGEGRSTFSTKVSSFVRDNGLIAGINAVPFDKASAEEGRIITNEGIIFAQGELIAPVNPRFDALVIRKDGRAAVMKQEALATFEDIKSAVGGFYQILFSGETDERTKNVRARHPRSAAGVSADGRLLYLLVIDGRRSGSAGATEEETALLLRAMGSWDAVNFDGGGSSALALRSADGSVRVANTPIHSGIHGQERAVAGCLGIKLEGSKEK
jgi:hypothetical protein